MRLCYSRTQVCQNVLSLYELLIEEGDPWARCAFGNVYLFETVGQLSDNGIDKYAKKSFMGQGKTFDVATVR